MNYRFIKRNTDAIDVQEVTAIAHKLKVPVKIVELMFCRGLTKLEDIERFLRASQDDLHNPFLMKGMQEAVERITQAIESGEKIMVYGDYDADGVCASAILSRHLHKRGAEVITYIPSRNKDGYGLNIETLEPLLEEAEPDLIITVDCGISASVEVAHVLDLGIDIIVTDHHEISSDIPECIVVNPKQPDCQYPIDSLCGAGVAFKLVEALSNREEAMQYIDLAALATIADLVPLKDENRTLVQLGLQKKHLRAPGLISLLKNQGIEGNPTATDIAYKIAPRINAAGRMGDATRAFELLFTSDIERIEHLIEEICEDNVRRKTLCETMFSEAMEDLQCENLVDTRAVVLSHPTWEKGITGILAAQVAGEYRRPTFIIVGTGSHCKGTCRGYGPINIYDLLEKSSDLLVEYGGHASAAGFTIHEKNIPELKKRLKSLLADKPQEWFIPQQEYDLDIKAEEITLEFVVALDLLEPFGNANTRPLFCFTTQNLTVAPMKNHFKHSNIVTQEGINIVAFNYYNHNQFLLGSDPKKLIVDLSVSHFGNRESVKVILKASDGDSLYISDALAKANYLKNVSIKAENPIFTTYKAEELPQLLNDKLYGTLLIAGSLDSYHAFLGQQHKQFLFHEFMFSAMFNNFSRIMVSPVPDKSLNLHNTDKIIFLDTPVGLGLVSLINKRTKATVYLPEVSNEYQFIKGVDISRNELLRYYTAFKENSDITATTIWSYFKLLKQRVPFVSLQGFVVALAVFFDLNLIKLAKEPFALHLQHGQKCDLGDSSVYQYLLDLMAKGEVQV